MHKLVVFGSSRVDAFLQIPEHQAKEGCDIDTKRCFIELSYAAKIPLKSASYLVGGNGANLAVGTKRLGIENTLVAELGEGIMADFAFGQLQKEIDTNHITRTQGVKEGFGAVIVYQGERTILSYYPPERPPFPANLENAEWCYLTSVGENFEGLFEDVASWLSKNSTKLIFNPSGRQIKKGKEWLSKYLERTDTLIVNREEGQDITGLKNTHKDEKKLLDTLSSLGPKMIVVTDAANGSYAKGNGKYYRLGILPIDAIERTGAGDAYSTGLLTGLMKGKSLPEAMLWGTVNSASVIGYIGSIAGLLRENEIEEWLKRAQSSGLNIKEF